MCCLPSHAFPVLCPSDLLSRTPSACQLTTDDHVLTPSTSNQIIWWLHGSQIHRQLDTLVLQHKRSWQGDPAGCLSYQQTGNNWQRMWATLGFTRLSIILWQLESPIVRNKDMHLKFLFSAVILISTISDWQGARLVCFTIFHRKVPYGPHFLAPKIHDMLIHTAKIS